MMGGGIVVTLFLLLFFFLLIAAVVGIGIWLYRENMGPAGRGTGEKPRSLGNEPLEILRRRYASGEITRDEYEQMRDDLTK